MDSKKLKNVAIRNEVRIDEHKGYKSNPQYYYASLKGAFGFYFNTFITNNATYDFYVEATAKSNSQTLNILESQFLDEGNTVLCLISFERFFELFIKDLLRKTHIKLSQSEGGRSKSRDAWTLIGKIQSNSFQPLKGSKSIQKPPFRETLKRFYELIEYSKDPLKNTNLLVKKFSRIIQKFNFLDDQKFKASFELLNWYRDEILHKGNKLPTLRFLDYIVTQRIIPIVNKFFEVDEQIPEEWLYFTKTISGVNIFEELTKSKVTVRNRKTNKEIKETIETLLYIGHLKELGRANMNMNYMVKNNHAIYEYNYKDPKGRGRRFAATEKKNHPEAVEIKHCPCCTEKSLILYRLNIKDKPLIGKQNIEWVKCYTCDYHLRYNVLDLHYFNKKFEKIFNY